MCENRKDVFHQCVFQCIYFSISSKALKRFYICVEKKDLGMVFHKPLSYTVYVPLYVLVTCNTIPVAH